MNTFHQTCLSLALAMLGGTQASAGDLTLFETRVRPALATHCYECHAGDQPKAGLRLDHREGWKQGGKSGSPIVPGRPEESLLIRVLRHEDPPSRMPKGSKRLPDDVIKAFETWIARGAFDPRDQAPSPTDVAAEGWKARLAERAKWWSLQAPRNTDPPAASDPVWNRNPVDRFIFRRLKQSKLSPASPAEAEVLLRRLSFVLTGLPPKPEHLDPFRKAYEADADAALGSLVDKLLASPHYGERFARHWMDVVRYTDTYGYEWDVPAVGSWEYRDYLIRAFNDDIGFDQLVREQIAGDLLPNPRINPEQQINESLIGPMFYHLGEHRHGSSINFNGIHQEMIDNKIDAFSKAFLAMTVACARCHDHKLDAISQKDYYALAGMFMTPRWTTRPIDAPERNAKAIQELKELRTRIHAGLRKLWQNSPNLKPAALRRWARNNHRKLAASKSDEIGHPFGRLVEGRSYQAVFLRSLTSKESTLTLEADGKTVLAAGTVPKTDIYTVEFDTAAGEFNGLRLEALTHPTLGQGGPGRTPHGNFVLSTITVEVTPMAAKTARKIALISAEADYNQPNYHVSGSIKPDARGWGVGLGGNVDRAASFGFADSVDLPKGGRWQVTLQFRLGSSHILGRFRLALGSPRAGGLSDEDAPKIWSQLAEEWKKTHAANAKANVAFHSLTDLSEPGLPDGWVMDGAGLKQGHVRAGTPRISLDGTNIINELFPAGYHTHALSPKLPGSLRLPDSKQFPYTNISILVAGGDWTSRRAIPQNAFLNEGPAYLDGNAGPQWTRITGGPYRNGVTRITTEIATASLSANFPGRTGIARYGKTQLPSEDEDRDKPSWFSLVGIVGHTPAAAPKPTLDAFADLYEPVPPATAQQAWERLAGWLNAAVDRWASGQADAKDVRMLNWLHEMELLPNDTDASPNLARLLKRYRDVEAGIRFARVVNTMDERHIVPVNYRLNIRGDVYQEGDAIRRNYLEVFAGRHRVLESKGSGRLELAEHLSSDRNPQTARVFVNRVWHWIFGAGIVPTPSDFGKLGGKPSHPELLDWLALEFMKDGWSTKRLIRRLVLSQTFRRSGDASIAAKEIDPRNRLRRHYPTRRLEAEAIRDSLLAVSGRLDPSLHGRPINPRRRAEDAKKRLFSGPLDGNGRRSLYQEMSIMQPPEFLVGFNLPDLKLPTGKRDVTNVPAQALTMLNDPFVNAMAAHWADQLVQTKHHDPESRTREMIRAAFSREPAKRELQRWTQAAYEFSHESDRLMTDKQAWQAVAHALFNTQEFLYYR